MVAPDSRTEPDSRTAPDYSFPWAGLLILASAVFVAVTSEFLPTGLLPDLSRSFDVSESQVGLLLTIFAGAVVLSAAPLTFFTRRVPRKALVIVVLLAFALGNLLAALAPSYEVLVVARVIGGLAHGLFWAVVGAYGSYLVPRRHLGRAIAITSVGGSAAFVLGVPLGTALGQALGWRLAFGTIAALVLVIVLLVMRFLPTVLHGEQLKTGEIVLPLRHDRTVLGVVLLCSIIIATMMGHNLFYTYIAPYLIAIGGFEEPSIAPILFIYGGGGALGLLLVGLLSDRYPRAMLIGCIGFAAASVLVIGIWHEQQWVVIAAIAVWAVAFGGLPSTLQTKVMHAASPRIRDAASAYCTTSANFAIGGGALLGGILLDGYGLGILPFVNVGFLLVGIALVVATDVVLRRRAR